MRTTSLLRLAAAPGVLAFAAFATPAFAQEPAETACLDSDNDGVCDPVSSADGTGASGAIVVTGSRIRRDEFTTAEPITVITSDEITQAGFSSATEALQSTEVTAGAAQINNYFAGFVTNGGTGANTVGLRGLGPERTLVLLNGHRLAPAGTRGSVGSVDLNILPTAILERIEVLKAGASSIYGSDAVAGVINLITDQSVEGLTIEGQVNVPEAGAGVAKRLSTVLGYNSDRFRIAASFDYFKRDRLSRNDRAFTRCPINGFITGPGAELGSGDFIDPATGAPKCFPLDNGGVTINTIGVASRLAVPGPGTPGTAGTTRFNRLRPNPAVTTLTPGFEGVSLDSRDTFDPQQEKEDLVTPAEIYTGFVQAGYDIGILGDAEAYVELLGNQRKSSSLTYRQLSLDYQVAVLPGTFTIDPARPNPLVPVMFQNSLFSLPNETTNGDLLGVRAFIGFGNLPTAQEVDFFKAAGGLRGDFSFFPEWRYDLYFSKSWSDGTYETETFLTDRVAKANSVRRNPDGTFSCTTTTDPNCVPAPPLTAAVIGGQLPQAYRDYIVENVIGTTKFRESTVSFNIDGPFMTLPGGQAQLALGAEYRKSRINDTPPIDSINNNLYNLTSAAPTRGTDSVWEVFGEVFLPLLADVPFAYRLNLTGSARYTEYDSYGGDETYKIAGEYEPFRGLAFRASYGTSYRAPALFEQFLGATSGFLSNQQDPCNQYGQSPDAVLRANCMSQGLAPDFMATTGIRVLNAGGAASGLEAETSTNLNLGVVIRPRLSESVGNLSLAFDYFDIEVKNGVSRVGAGNILQRCFRDPEFTGGEGFCRLVSRAPNDAQLTVNNNFINLSTDVVRGFEANLRYARDVGPGKLVLNAIVTKYEEQSTQLFADSPVNDTNGDIASPEWTGTANATYTWDKVSLRYGVDWVGKGNSYEAFDEDPATSTFFLKTPNYFLHNASVQYRLDTFELTAGVRNLFDRNPPRVSTTFDFLYNTVGNSPLYSGYDYSGRTFFVSAAAKF